MVAVKTQSVIIFGETRLTLSRLESGHGHVVKSNASNYDDHWQTGSSNEQVHILATRRRLSKDMNAALHQLDCFAGLGFRLA